MLSALTLKDFKGNPVKMKFWKRVQLTVLVVSYTLWYFKRNTITTGRLGNRIEIHKVAWGNTHKVRVAQPCVSVIK